MRSVAFFGHNSADAAIRRRVHAFQQSGIEVQGFMMRREDAQALPWNNVDLGLTADAAFRHRLRAIHAGARIAAKHIGALRQASLLYARNLDMLACAFLTRRLTGLDTPVVYECLDVHRVLTRQDAVGAVFRSVEGWLLARCALLVISSPAYLREYFSARHRGRFRSFLLENRLTQGMAHGPRPAASAITGDAQPLRIGWFGNLRCARSMALIKSLAARFEGRLLFELRGYPFRLALPTFEADVSSSPAIRYGGRYSAPDDLAGMYASVDVMWAGDYFEAGFNSRWLLPNRLYEGGYYGVPALAAADTETGRWVGTRQAGFTFGEPIEATVPALIERLLTDRAAIRERSAALLAMPESAFIQSRTEMGRLVDVALARSDA